MGSRFERVRKKMVEAKGICEVKKKLGEQVDELYDLAVLYGLREYIPYPVESGSFCRYMFPNMMRVYRSNKAPTLENLKKKEVYEIVKMPFSLGVEMTISGATEVVDIGKNLRELREVSDLMAGIIGDLRSEER